MHGIAVGLIIRVVERC